MKNSATAAAPAISQFANPETNVCSLSHALIPEGATVVLAPLESSVVPGCVKLGAVWLADTATVGEGWGARGCASGLLTLALGCGVAGGGCAMVDVEPNHGFTMMVGAAPSTTRIGAGPQPHAGHAGADGPPYVGRNG